jgi:pimeloyl-ACP methyl ester carboxylesterase
MPNSSLSIITLTGWGQSLAAFAPIAPHATASDYMQYGSLDEWLMPLAAPCDILIGWSLGGQLALRAAPLLKPRLLVLIATPFALAGSAFDAFTHEFTANPERTLRRFTLRMAQGDRCGKQVIGHATPYHNTTHLAYWLKLLQETDAAHIDMSGVPPTLIFHGENDVIVPFAQAEQLAKHIPGSQLIAFEQCGHAPHYHNPSVMNTRIAHEISHPA